MRKFTCKLCGSEIDFGVELKGTAVISEAIRQHEVICQDIDPIIIPITVHRLRKNGVRLMKLTNTPLSPGSAFNSLKDSASDLLIIAKELDNKQMEVNSCALIDLIVAFEQSMEGTYIWK
jgi:hypothetical protein